MYLFWISGSLNKKLEIVRPKRISELPEKLLMSGINLPGKEQFFYTILYAQFTFNTIK